MLLFLNKHDNLVYFIKAGVYFSQTSCIYALLPLISNMPVFSWKNICLGPKSTGDTLAAKSFVKTKTFKL